ncbi:hypothetical protein [Micromonospora sp. NBRC 101691]|uniref:hypothetical protein n=1 Tax=Micromonospora sp. NBRC 101691 TaxID=3032198 RepID=UPI0024A4D86B|nr:hypothetical protein [Micromonospora sp. NBRC 101691]GLY24033.1 hypothetical protein Misp04_37650 [Micromonospora sp. NBRC 101691]
MTLTYCPDTTAADWLVRSGTPATQLMTFGPASFEAFGRLRFIPDPVVPGQAETDADIPAGHPLDLTQARRALRLLARFTSTPQDCYFCVWEGYSDIPLPPDVRHGPLVEIPHRRYALLRGALHDIDAWEADLGGGQPIAPPAFVWPADRRWCFASDVDPHWAGIGAEQAAIDALIGDPRLDVVPARPAEEQPVYR